MCTQMTKSLKPTLVNNIDGIHNTLSIRLL